MYRHLTARALQRARWQNDLLTALQHAERLLALLEADPQFVQDAARLRQRIGVVRGELALLNRIMEGEERVIGPTWPAAETGVG
ncbi:MAG TPA: hypothetical protein VNA29_01520 [Sphingomicrobium sp.]|nr:hypothetical protein [Sphingomicrobium sp.]